MYRETLTLGVVPNKRSFLSMVEAKRQKDCFMEEIRKIKASIVEIVDIDDICENGIVCEMDKVNAIVDKMKNRKIDALFFPFCLVKFALSKGCHPAATLPIEQHTVFMPSFL